MSGWMLTPEGRAECHRLVRDEAEPHEGALRRSYQGFLAVNQRLIDACTAWQLRTPTARRCPTTTPTPPTTRRCWPSWTWSTAWPARCATSSAPPSSGSAGYGPRLAAARARVQAGETDWLTRPTIDSYHTVWFELHENLLMTLGIERGQERPEASTPLQEAR